MGGATPSRQLAGRIEEQRLLGEAVESAVDGVPSAVFVHGEAGSGKTYLVRAICDQAVQDGCAVLWGRCVHFGAVESPYLPLVNALESWIETAEPDEREAVLTAVDGVGELLPSLGRRGSDGSVVCRRFSTGWCVPSHRVGRQCWWWTICNGPTRHREMRSPI